MAVKTFTAAIGNPADAPLPRFFVADTDAEKPATGLNEGDRAYALDTNLSYVATGPTAWARLSGATRQIVGHNTAFTPIGLWQLNGDLTDSSGNAYDLTVAAGTARYTEIGPELRGLYFNGLWLRRTIRTIALDIAGNITIELIVRMIGTDAGYGHFVSYSGAHANETQPHNYLYALGRRTENLLGATTFGFWENGSGVDVATPVGSYYLPLHETFHLAMVRSNSGVGNATLTIYVNGVQREQWTGLADADTVTPVQTLQIGADGEGGEAIHAILASVKIVGSALSAANVLAEYRHCFYGE